MHTIQDKEFTYDDFSIEHVGDVPNCDPMYGDAFDNIIMVLNEARHCYLETKDKAYWWQMIQLLPSSYNQTRNVMINYEVLANIYKSRKSHPLDEWRDFCKFIEELPYSELICGEEIVDKVADKFCEIGNINPLSKEEIEQAVNLSRIKEN